MQGRHPLLIRASDPPVRLSRFEESLQTPGGTVQRDLRLTGLWGLWTEDCSQGSRKRSCAGTGQRWPARRNKERRLIRYVIAVQKLR